MQSVVITVKCCIKYPRNEILLFYVIDFTYDARGKENTSGLHPNHAEIGKIPVPFENLMSNPGKCQVQRMTIHKQFNLFHGSQYSLTYRLNARRYKKKIKQL